MICWLTWTRKRSIRGWLRVKPILRASSRTMGSSAAEAGLQEIRIFQFVFGAKKAARLDVTLVEQRLEQVIGLAQAGAKPFSKLPLAELWLFLDNSENAQVHLLGRGHVLLFNR